MKDWNKQNLDKLEKELNRGGYFIQGSWINHKESHTPRIADLKNDGTAQLNYEIIHSFKTDAYSRYLLHVLNVRDILFRAKVEYVEEGKSLEIKQALEIKSKQIKSLISRL